MKKISLVSSCYNEEENIDTLYERVTKAIEPFCDRYQFEYILLDNGSTDNTAQKLRDLAQKDERIKVILNTRNFGHIRSPYYGMTQADGDAVIYLASDLQDPPELIKDFIELLSDRNIFAHVREEKNGVGQYQFKKLNNNEYLVLSDEKCIELRTSIIKYYELISGIM